MVSVLVLALAHLVAGNIPVLAALWGMVAIACWYEWRRYAQVAYGAAFGLGYPRVTAWRVAQWTGEEEIFGIRCQEVVIRHYQRAGGGVR